MQRITPCLWFDNNTEEAVNLYASIFSGSSIEGSTRFGREAAQATGQAEGAIMTMTFTLAGQGFMALNGGPYYRHTPAISLFVNCETAEEVDKLWNGLSKNGAVLMGLDKYPFSEKFGWCQDKFGLSWQVNLGARPQKISPFLLFVNETHGKAAEAMQFFASIFDNGRILRADRFGAGQGEPEGSLMQGIFSLDGCEFRAMESAMNHEFAFTGAISFMVNCDTQHEIDRYWEQLSGRGGREIQCGWLNDRYGIFWQIVPAILGQLMKDPKVFGRVHHAVMQMGKLDIATLETAATGAS